MPNINILPDELLVDILSYLKKEDYQHIDWLSKSFFNLNQDKNIWRKRMFDLFNKHRVKQLEVVPHAWTVWRQS